MVPEFPTLALQIHKDQNDVYSFVLMHEVHVEKNIIWREEEMAEADLHRVRQALISTQFETVDKIPAWRIMVSPTTGGSHVSLFFHHALQDGTSAGTVLFAIRDALSQPIDNPTSLIKIPETAEIPQSVEHYMELAVTEQGKAKFIADLSKPPDLDLWNGGTIIDTTNFSPFTQAVLQTTSAQCMKILLAECRKNETTVTCFLVAVMLYAIDLVLGDDFHTKLLATVPQNLRDIVAKSATGKKSDKVLMGDFVNATLVPYTRVFGDSKPVSLDCLWSVARSTRQLIQEKALNITTSTADLGIAFMPYLGCTVLEHQKMLRTSGLPRFNSCEISSLVLPGDPPSPTSDQWVLKDPVFIQGNEENSAMSLSAIGYRGGDQVMSFTWASESLNDSIAIGVADTVKELIRKVVAKAS